MLQNKKTIILGIIFWFAIWQILAIIANQSLLIPIPTPVTMFTALIEVMSDKSFYLAVFFSFLRIATGIVLALVFGILLGYLCFISKLVKGIVSPLLYVLKTMPVACFIFLLFLWIKVGLIPTFISFFIVLPIVEENIEAGLRSVDKDVIEMVKVFTTSKKTLIYVLTGYIRPFFQTAVVTGLSLGWKSGIAAEIIARCNNSIGNFIWAYRSTIEYDHVFAVSFVIILISMFFESLVKRIYGGTR